MVIRGSMNEPYNVTGASFAGDEIHIGDAPAIRGRMTEMSLVDRPAAKDGKIATMQKLVIGFTGTRSGMTPIASAKLAVLLTLLEPSEAHHGDCVGADAAFHAEVTDWLPECRMVIHPGSVRGSGMFRAFCTSKNQITHAVKPALTRNKDIVNAIDVLIAAPTGHQEMLRSGTWATIRYARSVKRPIIMLYSDGRIDMEFPEDAQVPSLRKRTGRGSLKGQLSGDFVDSAAFTGMAKALEAMERAMKDAAQPWGSREWGSFAEIIRQRDLPKPE